MTQANMKGAGAAGPARAGRTPFPAPPGLFGAALLACSVLVVASLVATVALVID